MIDKKEQRELREKLLREFTYAVDHEMWPEVMKLFDQIEKIIDPNSRTMKLIKMDIESMPEEFRKEETE